MHIVPFLPLFLALASVAQAAPKPLSTLLQEFDQNSREFMDRIPEKRTRNPVQIFSPNAIRAGNYVTAKNQRRPVVTGRAGFANNDLAEDLVDNGTRYIRTLRGMESKDLRSAKLPVAPWSDYYWSLTNAQLAFRYQDKSFPQSSDWKVNSDYLNKNFFTIIPTTANATDTLSPAEKYDLLVGDNRLTLTKKALAQGEDFYRANGEVEGWMGICHGWAVASYMMDRPKNAVRVMAADGKTLITFLPSDIKALASLLWAVNPGETRFVGGRCNTKNPKRNSAGRVDDVDCFDTNPGTWHLAVVNQIGVNQRSLVMDATFDYEVWNHPLVSYHYEYFNPETLKPVKTLEEATVAIKDFKKDKFRKYRSSQAAFVVGISMNVDYMVENFPSREKKDGPENDSTNSVAYQYDLELDSHGTVVGGEWLNNAHPDFLWTATPRARALTPGDQLIDRRKNSWNGKSALPAEWQAIAARNSEGGAPLAAVVESLIQLSNSRSGQ